MRMSPCTPQLNFKINGFGRGQEEDVGPDRPDDVGPVERPPRSGGPAGHQEGEAG